MTLFGKDQQSKFRFYLNFTQISPVILTGPTLCFMCVFLRPCGRVASAGVVFAVCDVDDFGAANSAGKTTRVAQRPLDDGPPLTLREIQLAPVIWAKLSGFSWWPARVRV